MGKTGDSVDVRVGSEMPSRVKPGYTGVKQQGRNVSLFQSRSPDTT